MRQCLEVLRDGVGIRIVFLRCGDRYEHLVECVREDRKQTLLFSVEGDDQQIWPASPPLQQLTFERRPSGDLVALAVGMAGSSHWSLSAAADRQQQAVEFDVACRYTLAPHQLGTTYQVTGSCHYIDEHFLIEGEIGAVRLSPATMADWDAGAGRIYLRAGAQAALTARWQYRLQWASR